MDEAVQKTSEKLKCILDLMAPIRTFQVRKKYGPWMSQLTKENIKERDRAQQKAASLGCLQDWQYYKSLRNTINKSLKLEKKKWQSSKLEGFGNDSKTVWKNLKS